MSRPFSWFDVWNNGHGRLTAATSAVPAENLQILDGEIHGAIRDGVSCATFRGRVAAALASRGVPHLAIVIALLALLSVPLAQARAETGLASFYWHGARTASGERFRPEGMTAAHRTLPFGTRVRVTDRASGRSIVVRINDRGPFVRGRIIDLARGAARALGIEHRGVTAVTVEVVR